MKLELLGIYRIVYPNFYWIGKVSSFQFYRINSGIKGTKVDAH